MLLRMGGDCDVSAWYRSAGGSSARPFPRDSGWWEEAVSRENCSSSFLGVDAILTLHDRFHSFPSLQISSRLRASGWSWSQSSRKPCLQVYEPRPHTFDSHMCVVFHACDHRLKGLCVCVCVSGRLIQRRPHDACPCCVNSCWNTQSCTLILKTVDGNRKRARQPSKLARVAFEN